MLLGSGQIEDCQFNAEKMYNKAKEQKDNNMMQTLQNGKGSWSKKDGFHFVNLSLLLVKCYLTQVQEGNDGLQEEGGFLAVT